MSPLTLIVCIRRFSLVSNANNVERSRTSAGIAGTGEIRCCFNTFCEFVKISCWAWCLTLPRVLGKVRQGVGQCGSGGGGQ